MACFLASAATAVITTSVRKRVSVRYHLGWLNAMLWGGVAMLAVEHIAHGEIVLFPPFLTAMRNPADTEIMLKEIATVGTAMTAGVILVWGMMVLAANKAEKMWRERVQTVRL
jgi:hypothetical protein